MRVLKMRGTDHFSGESVFRITKEGVEIYPRLKPVVKEQLYKMSEERVSTGLPRLDEMMDGGIFRGTVTLLSGSSGTGKTLLALHFIHAGLLAGEKTVFVTFEENPTQILRSSRQMGLELQPYLDRKKLHIFHVSPIELSVDEHIFQVQSLVADSGATCLVIDSISSFEVGMKDKEKYTDYIWALTDYFKMQGVTVLLTYEIHNSDPFSTLTKHGISFVADNLILLRFIEEGTVVRRFLHVVKMRASSHDSHLKEMQISKNGIFLAASRETLDKN